MLTVLYYLNGAGATWFPLADSDFDFTSRDIAASCLEGLDPTTDGLRVEPHSAGDALAFFNFDDAGEPDPWTLHAGLEVAATETKWIGAHFFRAPSLCAGHEAVAMAARARQMEADASARE